jgi:hypothetical protein
MADSKVTIGGVDVPATVESTTLIRADAPPHAAGRVDVVVTTPRGSGTLTGGFNYALPPPPPPPVPTGLTLTGNNTLANAGDTSQFTTRATFADGSSADVSSDTLWTVSGTPIITISSSGLVTATGLGVTNLSARYPRTGSPSFSRFAQITVTPPGTFVLYGRTREPAFSSLPGVLVQHLGTGQSVTTTNDGSYSFGGVTTTRLSASRAGYEPVEIDGVRNEFFDVALQKVYRIGPDGASTQVLAPNDMIYAVQQGGPMCDPCHLVRLTSPSAGRITLRVTWSDSGPIINVWMNGQRFNGAGREAVAELDVSAGENLVYIGRAGPSGQYFVHTEFIVRTGPVTVAR